VTPLPEPGFSGRPIRRPIRARPPLVALPATTRPRPAAFRGAYPSAGRAKALVTPDDHPERGVVHLEHDSARRPLREGHWALGRLSDIAHAGRMLRRHRRSIETAHLSQATGMVCAQATCTPLAALILMEARAGAQDCPLEEIAVSVVDRKIRFGD
jgi:hypothetical protein